MHFAQAEKEKAGSQRDPAFFIFVAKKEA